MDLQAFLAAQGLPRIFAALVGLPLAAAVFAINPRSRVNRAFAAFLVFFFMTVLLNTLTRITSDPFEASYFGRLVVYFSMMMPVALLYFVSVFPRPRLWVGQPPWGPLAIVLLGTVLELAYFVDRSGFAILVGPAAFSTLGIAWIPLAPVVTLLLVRDYAKMAPGAKRRALFLVAFGFALLSLSNVASPSVIQGVLSLSQGRALASTSWGTVTSVELLIAAPLGIAAAYAFFSVVDVSGAAEAKPARDIVYGLGILAVASGPLAYFLDPVSTGLSNDPFLFLGGIWRLAFALLVAYAIVKHQLFDIDVRIKWTIKRGTLAAVFLVVFFVVAQIAQNYFSDEYGWAAGGIAAGLLLFVLSPIQQFAERVASTAMPGVKSVVEMSHPERTGLYLEHARIAWADGAVDKNERMLLNHLRERLGLSADEALRLETEATRA